VAPPRRRRGPAGAQGAAARLEGQLGQAAAALERAPEQRRLVEHRRIERARVARRRQRRVGLVVERHAELVGQRRAVGREVRARLQQPLP
jgi:hypothetical protein